MNQYLWINRWNDIRKKSAITKQKEGLTFLSIYTMEDFKRVLSELYMGLQMNEGSMTSRYVCFIPPNGNEVIKLRLSDHPSSPSEWGEKEITGLPNRRYSIVIFSKKSMPIETKQGIKELDWKSYSAQNIPTYEKTFNRYYLRETFDTLKSILATIYQGGSPEDNTIPINLAENKTRNNMNKKLIRLTESDLHKIVKESVNKVLTELDWKTYASAANKSNRRYFENGHNKKDLGRVGKFSDAAVKAFKEKYPEVVNQTDRKFDPYCDGYGMGYKAEHTIPAYGGGTFTTKADRTSNNMSDRVDHIIYDKDGNEEYYGRNVDSDYPYNDIEKDAVKDLDMFSRLGDLGYKKGKGWGH